MQQTRYLVLLRGVNVGGKNMIAMPELRRAFEEAGFAEVSSYINSGNILCSSALGAAEVEAAGTRILTEQFGLDVPLAVLTASELHEALAHAPAWWGSNAQANLEAKHNAVFVIEPYTTAEICAAIGETKPEYEQIAESGRVIFWSAPLETFSRTRLNKIVMNKEYYYAITVRNANTTLKLAALLDLPCSLRMRGDPLPSTSGPRK